MDGGDAKPVVNGLNRARVRRANAPADNVSQAFADIAEQIGDDELDLVVLFVTSTADLDEVAREAIRTFGHTRIVGCTTAGEISKNGYTSDEIVAIGFSKDSFTTDILFISDLRDIDRHVLANSAARMRLNLGHRAPQHKSEFAFLLVDGLSKLEDELVSTLNVSLGPMPLFGGSAGDGLDFKRTFVFHDGTFHQNAAVLCLFRTSCKVEVFKFDHLLPTSQKMVVTNADPKRRLVREINAEPAAREYARIVGENPEQLSSFIFAAHPVVVQVGGHHHVRAIQKVEPNGDLAFLSAIDEGLVLTVAEPQDISAHLEQSLNVLSKNAEPEAIIACDCILRRVEAEQKQAIRSMSQTLAKHRVVGFNTYGEQVNSVHVNQTMTGVAIYPPPMQPET